MSIRRAGASALIAPRPPTTRPPTTGPLSTRVTAIVVAIAVIAAAAALTRLSDPEAVRQETVRGVAGQPVQLNDGPVTVTEVRVGNRLEGTTEVYETPGMFVVVRVQVDASEATTHTLSAAALRSERRRYEPYGTFGVRVPPGFRTSTDVAFEVDPTHIEDLTLELGTREFVSGYSQRARVHLGISADNAAGWAAAARDRVVEQQDDDTRALS